MLTVLALIGLGSAGLLIGGFRSPPGIALGHSADSAEPLGLKSRGEIDVARTCEAAARSMAREAARRRVSLRLAMTPGVSVVGDAAGLSEAIKRLIGAAVAGHPGGAILVSVSMHGGRARVAVLGDGAGAPPQLPQAELRAAERTIALHGGTLDVETRARGAMLTMRLLATPAGWSEAADRVAADREAADREAERTKAVAVAEPDAPSDAAAQPAPDVRVWTKPLSTL